MSEDAAMNESRLRVPLSDIAVDDELLDAVLETVRSGWWSMGPRVEEFEREFAEFCGAPHAVAVANGTAALHLGLLAVGCGPGDEVIVPSLNFVAAANAIVHTGAEPVFCDIVGPDELNLDPADVEAAVGPPDEGCHRPALRRRSLCDGGDLRNRRAPWARHRRGRRARPGREPAWADVRDARPRRLF